MGQFPGSGIAGSWPPQPVHSLPAIFPQRQRSPFVCMCWGGGQGAVGEFLRNPRRRVSRTECCERGLPQSSSPQLLERMPWPDSPASLTGSWVTSGAAPPLLAEPTSARRPRTSAQLGQWALPARTLSIQRKVSPAAFIMTLFPQHCSSPQVLPPPLPGPPGSLKEVADLSPGGIIALVVRWPVAASSADSRLWAE